MGGCDEIDIMAAFKLETDHNIGKILITYNPSGSQLGDVIILAEYATQVAV
jgi:hypothetical protein